MSTFNVHLPEGTRVPILVSIPHCGTRFPDELTGEYVPHLMAAPDDTDWFVDRLYDFAPRLGITVISAVYSRWVIDLNRDPENKPLYSDGRIITELCPTTNFLGEPIYVDKREAVNRLEIGRRLDIYYWPYHKQLVHLLESMKSEWGKVLLWDAHSIRREVKTIYQGQFPDLILGDADETSAEANVIGPVLEKLRASKYSVAHNYPFKGGFITRHYGKPGEKQYALQLEMSKINYMDDSETCYDETRADGIKKVLDKTLTVLAKLMSKKA